MPHIPRTSVPPIPQVGTGKVPQPVLPTSKGPPAAHKVPRKAESIFYDKLSLNKFAFDPARVIRAFVGDNK